MLGTIFSGLGAVGSLAGGVAGLLSAGQAARAQREANQIAMLDYLERRSQADRAERQAREGTTDSRGNRVRYVPGYGWVTDLTEAGRIQQSAADNEQYLRNSRDSANARLIREAAIARQLREADIADQLLAQRDVAAESVPQLQSAMIAADVAQAAAPQDALRRAVSMNALRQGTGAQALLAELSRRNMQDRRSAIANAELRSRPEYINRMSNREGAIGDIYNMYASRATADRPTQLAMPDIGQGAAARGQAALAQAMAQRINMEAPRMGYQEDRTPTALAGLGSAFRGFANWWEERERANAKRNLATSGASYSSSSRDF
jgi:hypothetical protein